MRPLFSSLLFLTAATVLVVPPCSAQHAIEITPFLGAYLPGADSRVTVSYGHSFDTYTKDSAAVGQHPAATGGIRLTAWFGRRWATEMSIEYSPSGTGIRADDCNCIAGGGCVCSSVTATDMASRIVTGSARVLFGLSSPALRHPSPYAVAGIGVFHRSGPGFEAAGQTAETAIPSTDWGPLLGVGARMRVTPTLTPRAELLLTDVTLGSRPRADLVFSVGLSKTLAGGASSARPQN